MEEETYVIRNIDKYTMEYKNGTLYIKLKKKFVSIEEIRKIDLIDSHIINCEIYDINGDVVSNNKDYKNIIIDIWIRMYINNKLNRKEKNYKSVEELVESFKRSFKYKNNNDIFNDIIDIVKYNRYIIDMTIKLHNNEVIYFTH